MKEKKYYFVIWKSKNFMFGFNICIYPDFSLHIQLPFLDIRMGFSYK